MTDVAKGSPGNDERLAFLFDTTRVKPSGLACELVEPVETDPAKIKPASSIASSRARPTPSASSPPDKPSSSLHVDYGTTDEKGRVPEFEAIAGWAETEFGWDHNLIAW